MKQRMGLGDIGHIRRRAHDGVHQPRLRVRADVRLHAEIPLVALLGLVHAGGALLLGILGRRRRVDDGGVDHRPLAHEQSLLTQELPHFLEDFAGQLMALQQVAELQKRRRVGRGLDAQIDPGKGAHRLAVVDRVFECFIGQSIPLLQKIEAQHPLDPDGRTPAQTQRIVRLNQSRQPGPGHHLFHLPEKPFPPRDFLFVGIFRLRKTDLLLHASLYQNQSPEASLIQKKISD